MFRSRRMLLFLFVSLLYGCGEKLPYGNPVVDPRMALKEKNFPGYWRLFMNLSTDFTGLDSLGNKILKGDFLNEVSTGKYLPLRLSSDSGTYFFRLYPVKDSISDFVRLTLMGLGAETYKKYMWEGKQLPVMQYTDLNRKVYNNRTLSGKTVVIDFWFIGCTACVQEFPLLNKLVDSLKSDEIVFLSFAFDEEHDLKTFLNKTSFQFEVISDTSAVLNKTLGIRAYPTQVVVGKDGRIVKIIDDPYHRWENLMAVLRNR